MSFVWLLFPPTNQQPLSTVATQAAVALLQRMAQKLEILLIAGPKLCFPPVLHKNCEV